MFMNLSMAGSVFLVTIEEVASSRARLRIANLLSSRPATLGELADLTGISVQGVLKHLVKLRDEGILAEKKMRGGRFLSQRKLYYVESRKIADYSEGDLLVATIGRSLREPPLKVRDTYEELDWLAQDIVIMRRRARELSQRMKRVLDEVTEDEARIGALIEGMSLSPEEEQIAYLIFAEDTPEHARAILKEHYGCSDPEAAMKAVVTKVRRGRS